MEQVSGDREIPHKKAALTFSRELNLILNWDLVGRQVTVSSVLYDLSHMNKPVMFSWQKSGVASESNDPEHTTLDTITLKIKTLRAHPGKTKKLIKTK